MLEVGAYQSDFTYSRAESIERVNETHASNTPPQPPDTYPAHQRQSERENEGCENKDSEWVC